jgi:hypothetical protein
MAREIKVDTETFGEVTLKFQVRDFEGTLVDCVNILDCCNENVGRVDMGDLNIPDITGKLIDQWYLDKVI